MNWLDLCRDRACIACGRNDGTTVPAHRNEGKGMGMKTPDWTVIPLCHKCHQAYDSGPATKEEKRQFWRAHHHLHLMALMEAELIGPVAQKRAQLYRIPRIVPRSGPEAA